MYENLIIEVNDGIATVQVNRPKALNALNKSVLTELKGYFLAVNDNDNVKCIVLTGAGDKAFVAGADIAAMKEMNALDARTFCELGHQTMSAVENCKKPVIAAVNGFCLGGGMELALACDFIYAVENAKFGLLEVNLGLFPGFGGTQRLARLVGKNRARELVFTARMILAQQAYEWNIVNQVCSAEQLMSSVQSTAKEIMSKGPIAVALAKEVINAGSDLDIHSGLMLERNTFPLIFATEDRIEGVSAFLEKRKADFTGK